MADESRDIERRLSRLEGSDTKTTDYLRAITDLVLQIERERKQRWAQTVVVSVSLLLGLLGVSAAIYATTLN